VTFLLQFPPPVTLTSSGKPRRSATLSHFPANGRCTGALTHRLDQLAGCQPPAYSSAPTVPWPQLSYLLPPGAAGSTLVTADDDGKLSWAVRIAVAVAVFLLGILVGAAVAAWVVPPI
jgi:hypothetical protein